MFNQVGLFDETLKIVLKICEKQAQQAIFKRQRQLKIWYYRQESMQNTGVYKALQLLSIDHCRFSDIQANLGTIKGKGQIAISSFEFAIQCFKHIHAYHRHNLTIIAFHVSTSDDHISHLIDSRWESYVFKCHFLANGSSYDAKLS